MDPMIDWDRCRKLAYEGRYLFCSTARMDDPSGIWLRAFAKQAPEHNAEIVVENGYVYIMFVPEKRDIGKEVLEGVAEMVEHYKED